MIKTESSQESRRRRRYRIHANPFNVKAPETVPDWTELYGREAPLALEIGFGPGQFLLGVARKNPHWNVLGFEIREHLVDAVLADAEREGLTNVHAMVANANLHLDDLVKDGSVTFVSVNFPDPWFKKRHHKRRVVTAEWLDSLGAKLQPGAAFHLMTDFEPIGVDTLELIEQHPDFKSHTQRGTFAGESTTGIVSEREMVHTRRGDPIYRVHCTYEQTIGDNLPL